MAKLKKPCYTGFFKSSVLSKSAGEGAPFAGARVFTSTKKALWKKGFFVFNIILENDKFTKTRLKHILSPHSQLMSCPKVAHEYV